MDVEHAEQEETETITIHDYTSWQKCCKNGQRIKVSYCTVVVDMKTGEERVITPWDRLR